MPGEESPTLPPLEERATENHKRTVFLYVIRGEVRVAGTVAPEMNLVELNDDGESVAIEAVKASLVIFGDAAPYGEPVIAHGPFVMNTREEIVQAIRDYEAGKFRQNDQG
jgi:redox-sensitive bicupin YhaK (pirin superfamily)